MKSRSSHPLVVVDIAVPRDVEPEVADIEGVFLYDIDDLTKESRRHRRERESEINWARIILNEEMIYYMAQYRERRVMPTISKLMQMADDIRRQQLNMTLKKMPSLSDEEKESIDSMTRAIVNKVLYNPVQSLKNNGHESEDLVGIVRELFALDVQATE